MLRIAVMVQLMALSVRDELVARRHREQGQGSLEYLAVLAVAAAVVTVFVGMNLPAKAAAYVAKIAAGFT